MAKLQSDPDANKDPEITGAPEPAVADQSDPEPSGDAGIAGEESVGADEGVRYKGRANARNLDVKTLENLGALGALADLRWSADNNFIVPRSEINDSTLAALLKTGEFEVVSV